MYSSERGGYIVGDGATKKGLLASLEYPNLRVPSDDRKLPKRTNRGTVELFTTHCHERTEVDDSS